MIKDCPKPGSERRGGYNNRDGGDRSYGNRGGYDRDNKRDYCYGSKRKNSSRSRSPKGTRSPSSRCSI